MASLARVWSGCADLNRGPHGPKPCALPTAPHPAIQHSSISTQEHYNIAVVTCQVAAPWPRPTNLHSPTNRSHQQTRLCGQPEQLFSHRRMLIPMPVIPLTPTHIIATIEQLRKLHTAELRNRKKRRRLHLH